MTKRKPQTAFAFATNLGAAAMHTGMTLWYRWPLLTAVATRSIRPRDAAELNRMVSEKITATSQGVLNAQLEVFRMTVVAVAGKLELSDAYRAPLAIMTAALNPALRRVKANSRRLKKRA